MKRTLIVVSAVILLLGVLFSACGKKTDSSKGTTAASTTKNAMQQAATNAGDAVGDVVTGAADIAGDVVTGAADIFCIIFKVDEAPVSA